MLDKTRVRDLRVRLQNLLEGQDALAFLGDLKAHVGNARFDENTVTFKIELATIGTDGEVHDKAFGDFKALAVIYGLKPEDLGRTFSRDGRSYKVTGLNPKRGKYPVTVERNDGKKFKFSAETVKLYLNK